MWKINIKITDPLQGTPPVSGEGDAWPNEAENYAGSSIATGRCNMIKEFKQTEKANKDSSTNS
jgi:hypothetical protein